MVSTNNHSATTSGLADPRLLDKIDRLFECGVGKYVSLPQLVVVGDQSSGKSSVLEGVTGLPFPRDSGLCTRFATQITFRRDASENISISITPSKDASTEHIAAVSAWKKNDLHDLDATTFGKIMQDAQEVMGVSGNDTKGVAFSDDVLKLELSGPHHEHLSVVDVPGIFRNGADGTTADDMMMVRKMVLGYMKNSRSIMLAVIPANVDLATQEILQMAKELDKEGTRTLGVLTKPDRVEPGTEGPVVDLLKGTRQPLKLGWHVVRNPGPTDLTNVAFDRDAEEKKFFMEEMPWARVNKDKAGIASLKVRLQKVLADHIRREFPLVRNELQIQLKACRQQHEALGTSRETPAEQSKYLLDMSVRYQELTAQALITEYAGDEVFDICTELRIATLVRNRSEAFGRMFERYGHAYEFDHGDDAGEDEAEDEEEKDDQSTAVRMLDDLSDLEDVTSFSGDYVVLPEEQEILEWLRTLYHNSRGFEIGTFQASILSTAMKKQSVKWESIAKGYVSDIITIVHNFVGIMLQHVCPDEVVRRGLTVVLMDSLVPKYLAAIEHVSFLLQVECAENPGTLNQCFAQSLRQSRHDRHDRQNVNGLNTTALVEKMKKFFLSQDHDLQEIHDILKSYYHIARERFVDNVFKQAASHHLVIGRDTPLKLFGPGFVSSLSEEQLEEIAGEDYTTKTRRQDLKKQIDELEAGKKALH